MEISELQKDMEIIDEPFVKADMSKCKQMLIDKTQEFINE